MLVAACEDRADSRAAPAPEAEASPAGDEAAGEPDPDEGVDVISQAEPAPTPFAMAPVLECEALEPVPERRLRVARDLVFSRAGGEPIAMDLFGPRGDEVELAPVVLLLHGGGWRRGERGHVSSMARALAGRGFVGAAVDFRLADAPRATFPAPIADVRCAVRWLRAHGRAHGVDPDRIGVVGFSSGGHMAAMLATAADVRELDAPGCLAPSDVSPAVQSAAAWFAPLDLRRRIGQFSSRPHVVNLLGTEPERAPERTALASPITHVSAGDAPMLLVHGTEDPTVDLVQSVAMRDALAAVSVPVVYVELEGAGHGFGLLSTEPVNRPGMCTTVEFLRRTLFAGGGSHGEHMEDVSESQ